jgi:hypothetical protein
MESKKDALSGVYYTRDWVVGLVGDLYRTDMMIHPEGYHRLPRGIAETVPDIWTEAVEDRKKNLLKKGVREEDIIIESVNGLSALYVVENSKKSLKLFPGPMVRFNGMEIDDKVHLNLGNTNYADLLATNNHRPFEIIEKYGMKGLANPVNVQAVITLKEDDKPVFFIYKRGSGLGEYPSQENNERFCLVAGGLKNTDTHPHDALEREAVEEQRLLKDYGDDSVNYIINHPIFPVGTKMGFMTRKDGQSIAEVWKGEEESDYLYLIREGSKPITCTGIITNVDPDDLDEEGGMIPHFRPEICYLFETNLQAEDAMKRWRRGSEHAGFVVFPFNEKDFKEYVIENFKSLLPTTTGTMVLTGNYKFGERWYKEVIEALNERYPPNESDHPYFGRVLSGEIPIEKTLTYQTKQKLPDDKGKVIPLRHAGETT